MTVSLPLALTAAMVGRIKAETRIFPCSPAVDSREISARLY
jgi:hypothetical protein